jgi:hypothetical protein
MVGYKPNLQTPSTKATMSWVLGPDPCERVCKPTRLGSADPFAWGLHPRTLDLQTRSLGFAKLLA